MFSYLVDLYNRAIKNQKLTAQERAGLKAVQGAIIGFLVSLLPQLISVIVGHGTFNFSAQAVNTLLTAFILALFKLWAAQTDGHIGDIIDAYSKQLEAQGIGELTSTPDGATLVPAIHIVVPTTHALAKAGVMALPKPIQELVPEAHPDELLLHSEATEPNVPTPSNIQPQVSLGTPMGAKQFVASPVVSILEKPTSPMAIVTAQSTEEEAHALPDAPQV